MIEKEKLVGIEANKQNELQTNETKIMCRAASHEQMSIW